MSLLLPLAILAACGAPAPVLRDVPVQGGGDLVQGETVATFELDGAAVQLDLVRVQVTDLRLQAPPEATAARRWTLPGVAHAHPGHDFTGDVMGELLGTWDLDLLAAPVELGTAACYSGDYETARLQVGTARLQGSLARDGVDLPFDLVLDLAQAEVTGIPLSWTLADEGAAPTLVLTGAPQTMLAAAALAQAVDTDGDGQLTLSDGTLANSAPFGLLTTPAWTVQALP